MNLTVMQISENPIEDECRMCANDYCQYMPDDLDYVEDDDPRDALARIANEYDEELSVNLDAMTITATGAPGPKAQRLRRVAERARAMAKAADAAADTVERGEDPIRAIGVTEDLLYNTRNAMYPRGDARIDDHGERWGHMRLLEWLDRVPAGTTVHVGGVLNAHI